MGVNNSINAGGVGSSPGTPISCWGITIMRQPSALTSWGNPVDIGEELALCYPRIPHQKDVDVATNLHAMRVAVHSTHQQQQQGLLHILMPIDLWGKGARQLLVKVILCNSEPVSSVRFRPTPSSSITTYLKPWYCLFAYLDIWRTKGYNTEWRVHCFPGHTVYVHNNFSASRFMPPSH